jgi:16S rRNA (uracil1498-N3)-methyltransferase
MRTLLVPSPLTAGLLRLDGDEAHHGRTVLRLAAGDQVRLADGAGRAAVATVAGCSRHHLELEVEAPTAIPDGPAAQLAVAFAPPKGDRLADTVRALTELGVGTLIPLACRRGERIPGNPERLLRVAGEALKQCRRGRLPVLSPAMTVHEIAARGDAVLLDPQGGPADPGTPRPTTLVIGPEGGLSDDELDCFRAARARFVRIAGPILRIETAAIAAAGIWTAAWECTP